MGTISEQLLARDVSDRAFEQNADEALEANRAVVTSAGDHGMRDALNCLLGWMGLNANVAFGFEDASELLEYTLSPLGIMYEETDLTDSTWRNCGEIALARKENGDFIACKPDFLSYYYECPRSGEKGRLGKKVALQPTGWVVYRPLPRDAHTLGGYFLMVMKLCNRGDVLCVLLASALVYMLGLVAPELNSRVLNDIVPQGMDGLTMLMMAFVAFLTVGFVKAAVRIVKSLFLSGMRLRIAGQAEAAVMAKTLLLPQSFFGDVSSGKISRRISSARQIADRMVNFVLNLGLTAIFSLGYIPQMVAFGPLLAVPALAVLACKSAFAVVVAIANTHNESESMKADVEQSGFLLSALKGVQTIRAMGAERRVYARWASIYQRVLKLDLDQPIVLKLENEITSAIASVGTIALVAIVVGSDMSRGDYIAFNAVYAMVVAAVGELLDSMRSIMLMGPLMQQLQDILNAKAEISMNRTPVRSVAGAIELDHVNFSYPGGMGTIEDLSLRIRPGEKVAFVGESGCGKSTMIKLILGAEKPLSGAVYIDGRDLKSLDVRSFRRRVGNVSQSSRLIPGTVRSNISFTSRKVSEEEAWDAAEKACIADDLREMPLGLDTEISESNSCGFSGGQRQRILIARAFASKPDIMIMDEATSALDNVTQKKVLDSIYAQRCTVLMVAHRLSTVVDCDRIMVVDKGSIVEEGTYEELMAYNGRFARLVQKQVL